MKHKVGDRVKVRTRESMEKEFGVDCYGDITHKHCCFFRKMQKYCGKYLIVFKINDDGYDTKEGSWLRADRMFDEEELKEGDIVYVSVYSKDSCLKNEIERIFIAKTKYFYICVKDCYEEEYNNGNPFETTIRKYAVKKPIEEKKERKVMMTDSEREELKKRIE